MEGPFSRREPGRNPIASELDRLDEQERVHHLGGRTSTQPSLAAGTQSAGGVSNLGQLAASEAAPDTAPEGTPSDSSWYNPERVAGRKTLAGLSDQALALQAGIADSQLRAAADRGDAMLNEDGSVTANNDPDGNIGSNTDIMHEWFSRGHSSPPTPDQYQPAWQQSLQGMMQSGGMAGAQPDMPASEQHRHAMRIAREARRAFGG